MQNPSPFSSPPIPTPDGSFSPVQKLKLPMDRSDWQTAPKIVKGWAYPIARLGIFLWPFIIALGLWEIHRRGHFGIMTGTTAYAMMLIYALLFVTDIWLTSNIKKGVSAAWTVQLIKSCFGVLNSLRYIVLPGKTHFSGVIGLAIGAYILSQWFKPETKAWFGKS